MRVRFKPTAVVLVGLSAATLFAVLLYIIVRFL